ncbi:MAG: ral secretion pathway protein [Chthoniobacter sp.]|jgi:type II secretory pathway component GspD/PulD (secretin)|nr:ral secretion pathway protein [Chthoniobacter sp.]
MKPDRLLPLPHLLLRATALWLATLLLPSPAWSQEKTSTVPVAASERVGALPAAPAVPAAPATPPAAKAAAAPLPGLEPELDPLLRPKAPATPAKGAPPAAKIAPPPAKGGIMLNFQGASLTDVLNYLSEAAGFVIVQEVQVSGTVNVVSRQAISAEEAVDLLNAVLIEKGYIAIRNGRILKIVNRKDAQKLDLPVKMGSDPELIPRKDEMITQILPLRFGEAAKLVENLRPLLSENATISANDSSNSILMTDTQTNIRRIAQIIRAIDTSVASISTIHVYPLQYADAKSLAPLITQLFAVSTTGGAQGGGGRGGGRGGFGGGGFGGGGFGPGGGAPGGGAAAAPQSEARQAASRVIAVADEQSNSLIVSAPEDLIPSITDIVNQIDTSTTEISETRIFRLLHADAVETADILNNLYGEPTQSSQGRNNNNQRGGQGGGRQFGGGAQFGQPGQQAAGGQQSARALLQEKVVAVGDPRTNSLLVSAAREQMIQIAETVGHLDASDAKKQHVYVHSLEHADADSVANVLRGMLGDTSVNTNTNSAAKRLTERSGTGASMDTSDASNTGTGGSGGSRAR